MVKVPQGDPVRKVVTLKAVADYLHLTPGTVSSVLNDAPSAKSIPQHTRDRIVDAARELKYRPNFFARTLRKKRTFTVGVIAEEIGDVYGAMVISGIEACLRKQNYFFFTVIHRHDPSLLKEYSDILVERGVEGFITIDTSLASAPLLPTVSLAGHRNIKGVTNIVLDHRLAALEALTHLKNLGHQKIAFMKGQVLSSDSEERWRAIAAVAEELDIKIDPRLVVQIEGNEPTPEIGYPFAKELLARRVPFTALFAYNDLSAIGAMQAIKEAGHRVPEDISVVGFDDIREAAFHNPSLTTIRQPLRTMGETAAATLISRIESGSDEPAEIAVEPQLIVRNSTARASARIRRW